MHPPARSVPSRLFAVLPALGIAFAVLTFYLVEAWTRKTPWIFTDELEWTQISRSIAATGHAARRGQPIFFKSLYAWVIAPCWWIHSTASAYAAVKYVNAVVMSLAAIPTYLLARMFVTRRSAVARCHPVGRDPGHVVRDGDRARGARVSRVRAVLVADRPLSRLPRPPRLPARTGACVLAGLIRCAAIRHGPGRRSDRARGALGDRAARPCAPLRAGAAATTSPPPCSSPARSSCSTA